MRKNDSLRNQSGPTVLGYALDPVTLCPVKRYVDMAKGDDNGADPLGDGTFRMVPSGDVVSHQERNLRLENPPE